MYCHREISLIALWKMRVLMNASLTMKMIFGGTPYTLIDTRFWYTVSGELEIVVFNNWKINISVYIGRTRGSSYWLIFYLSIDATLKAHKALWTRCLITFIQFICRLICEDTPFRNEDMTTLFYFTCHIKCYNLTQGRFILGRNLRE